MNRPAGQAERFAAHEAAAESNDHETGAALAAPPYPKDATAAEVQAWVYRHSDWQRHFKRQRMGAEAVAEMNPAGR